jgi:hypothetical protein
VAVTFDAVGPGTAGTASSATPLTWSHTCVATASAILVAVTTFTGSVNAVTGVTYGGVPCSLLKFQASNNGPGGGIALYYLDTQGGMPTGKNTVSAAFTGAADTIGGSVSASGSGGHGAVVTGVAANQASVSASVPNTITGGLIVACACFGGGAGGGSLSGTNSVTAQWSRIVSTNSAADNAAEGTVASTGGAASQTVGFQETGAGTDNWGLVAVELLPAVIYPLRTTLRVAVVPFTSGAVF